QSDCRDIHRTHGHRGYRDINLPGNEHGQHAQRHKAEDNAATPHLEQMRKRQELGRHDRNRHCTQANHHGEEKHVATKKLMHQITRYRAMVWAKSSTPVRPASRWDVILPCWITVMSSLRPSSSAGSSDISNTAAPSSAIPRTRL